MHPHYNALLLYNKARNKNSIKMLAILGNSRIFCYNRRFAKITMLALTLIAEMFVCPLAELTLSQSLAISISTVVFIAIVIGKTHRILRHKLAHHHLR